MYLGCTPRVPNTSIRLYRKLFLLPFWHWHVPLQTGHWCIPVCFFSSAHLLPVSLLAFREFMRVPSMLWSSSVLLLAGLRPTRPPGFLLWQTSQDGRLLPRLLPHGNKRLHGPEAAHRHRVPKVAHTGATPAVSCFMRLICDLKYKYSISSYLLHWNEWRCH